MIGGYLGGEVGKRICRKYTFYAEIGITKNFVFYLGGYTDNRNEDVRVWT
jgi:hypothetical protein